jgi:choline dehydrogenase-like flavoprotein
MIHDFHASGVVSLPKDAIVVVGAGAAGIPLAVELADRGHQVVLLESGGDVRDRGALHEFDSLNEGLVDGQPFLGLASGRARVLGGTTQLWLGQCMRMLDIDLRSRPWVPNSGWPITLDELEMAYTEAERWLDVSGRGYGEDRWVEFPKSPPVEWNPDHLQHALTEFSHQPRLGAAYRDRLTHHRNLWVIVHATVSKVHLDGGRTRGVEVVSMLDRRLHIDATTVVLAAGTIENTRLLQLSDPSGVGLGTGRAHTGRYLQDHPIVRTAEILAPDYNLLQDLYGGVRVRGRRLWPRVHLATKAQEQYELLDAVAVFDHTHEGHAVEAARKVLLALRNRALSARSLLDLSRAAAAAPILLRTLYRRHVRGLQSIAGRPTKAWVEVWVEQAPKVHRRISLTDSTDALGLPRVAVTWTCDAEELETSRQLTRWIAEDLEGQGVARVRLLPAMVDDAAWLATVRDGYHPAGTTRMSDSPQRGVVDRNLAVHGVDGLYVVGGSVFPTSGYANPTLTIVALALRLAAHLDDVLRR